MTPKGPITDKLLLALLFTITALAIAPRQGRTQTTTSQRSASATDAFPKPSRPVAGIVSPIWHSEDERNAANEIPQVVRLMQIEQGMTVADIGAGSGYYVVRLAAVVGAQGRILAEDITPRYVRDLKSRVEALSLANVTVSLGEADDPKFSPRSVDRVLMVHMYHEVSQPFGLLFNLATALKPGAKVGIVDAFKATAQHGTPPALLKCEVEAMNYRQTSFSKLEATDAYLAIFEISDGASPTPPSKIRPCDQR